MPPQWAVFPVTDVWVPPSSRHTCWEHGRQRLRRSRGRLAAKQVCHPVCWLCRCWSVGVGHGQAVQLPCASQLGLRAAHSGSNVIRCRFAHMHSRIGDIRDNCSKAPVLPGSNMAKVFIPLAEVRVKTETAVYQPCNALRADRSGRQQIWRRAPRRSNTPPLAEAAAEPAATPGMSSSTPRSSRSPSRSGGGGGGAARGVGGFGVPGAASCTATQG